MHEVRAFEAKNKLGRLFDRVEASRGVTRGVLKIGELIDKGRRDVGGIFE